MKKGGKKERTNLLLDRRTKALGKNLARVLYNESLSQHVARLIRTEADREKLRYNRLMIELSERGGTSLLCSNSSDAEKNSEECL